MNDLFSYLWAQSQRRPLETAKFAAGELWRRGKLRWSNSLEKDLPWVSTEHLADRFRPFLPPACETPAALREAFPGAAEACILKAERIARHELEIFGEQVALGPEMDWHSDWKTGHRWPADRPGPFPLNGAAPGTDIKRPWELARFHHGVTLGQAFLLTGHAGHAAEFAAQVRHWLRHNPYPRGIHWAMPMEVAVRAVNWITAAAFFAAQPVLDESFWQEFLNALFLHGRYVFTHREWNPVARGNHYLVCVVGLVYLGAVFHDTPESRHWIAVGRKTLAEEMDAQVGTDGVAHEGSSGYHALVTELMLSGALVLARHHLLKRGAKETPRFLNEAIVASLGSAFAQKLEKMFEFTAALCSGRECAPLWGDSDDGRLLPFCSGTADAPAHLVSVGKRLFARDDWSDCRHKCEEVWWRLGAAPHRCETSSNHVATSRDFSSAGFFFFASPRLRGSVRCGPLGVNGWANHAHCDQLSLEFCWDGKPVLVDPGTFYYSGDVAARNLFRSTRSHNTPVVAGAEQNRFWPGLLFRMLDDTRSRLLRWQASQERVQFAGEHFGYARLKQGVRVKRALTVDTARDTLLVYDTLAGGGRAKLEWNFHLAPEIPVQRLANTQPRDIGAAGAQGAAILPMAPGLAEMKFHSAWRLGPVQMSVWTGAGVANLDGAEQSGWVAPRYGRRAAAPVLRFACEAQFPARAAFVFEAFPSGSPEST